MEVNKIYCENCLDTMARMPNDFIDLTVTSPPYDDMDENFNPIAKNGLRTYNGYEWNFKKIADELFRVTKQGGVVVWVVNDPTIKGSESLASCYQKIYFRKVGFNIHDTMIFYQNGTGAKGSNYSYWQSFEYMFVLAKYKIKTVNRISDILNSNGGKKRGSSPKCALLKTRVERKNRINPIFSVRPNVWKYPTGFCGIKTDHPAPFLEKLANDHIISWSNEGDLIYDPFMGSGTTAKMSILNNRNWIGSEISSEYCDIIEERIKKAWEEKRKEKDLQAGTLFGNEM